MTTNTGAPPWPACGFGPAPVNTGCRGRSVDPYVACLEHLTDQERAAYLTALAPGSALDHRGTVITSVCLVELLAAVVDQNTDTPCPGDSYFGGVTFAGDADFEGVTFAGNADFGGVTFAGDADFEDAAFTGNADFEGVRFSSYANFEDVAFAGNAAFMSVAFTGDADFEGVRFSSYANFGGATFASDAAFKGATFTRHADFDGVRFSSYADFEDVAFAGNAAFASATFTGDTNFAGATFAGYARFWNARFTDAQFLSATFTGRGDFGYSKFTGRADFLGVTFTYDADFRKVTFTRGAHFEDVTFTGYARFMDVTFTGGADFGNATFTGNAAFAKATFSSDADFVGVTFAGYAHFVGVTFAGDAEFGSVTFTGDADFRGSVFSKNASFRRAQIQQAGEWDLVCDGVLQFDEAVFQRPVLVRAAARTVEFRRTHFVSTAHLRLKYATVDLTDAVLEAPTTVAPANTRFITPPGTASTLLDPPRGAALVYPAVKVASVSGVDAAHLVLADVDLIDCHFAGAVHLDQLRMDGHCTLAQPPTGLRRRRLLPVRHTRRSVIAEERHWQHARSADGGGWPAPAAGPTGAGPAALAAVYRQLRKSLEDGKNEAEAADFYYGEMQMRRHNRARPGGERALLAFYWAVSGYGQRASRAFGWLLAAMATTLAGMVLWGLPVDDPKPLSQGDVVAGHVTLVTDTPPPVNPKGPLTGRVTGKRTEKAGRVVVNSVIFRSSGQNLTTAGTYLEMASRLTEPVLLGFGLLAVRSRVKR
ncbi:pentapeptide repeat-containing protein [Kitasatospora purpeofusca]|uniref:pentapeptide repeat-containing protein n=1 Tax=Kitasatospora purpeofusca TaxID=67352 RepID=UPI00068C6987|nr:pentapeptide repeat-containing protein [Kitasatospora purpeofusca]